MGKTAGLGVTHFQFYSEKPIEEVAFLFEMYQCDISLRLSVKFVIFETV